MPLNVFEMGKRTIRQNLPPGIGNVLGTLEQAGILNTGLYHMNRAGPPQLSYMWEVVFRDGKSDGEFLTAYAMNANLPASMNENIKRWYAGVEYSYSGRDTSPRVARVTFWDNQDLEVYKFFYAWFSTMQQGATNRKVNPENYLREIDLVLNDSFGVQQSTIVKMTDAYPTEIGDVQLSYDSSGVFTFDVMFSYRRKVIL